MRKKVDRFIAGMLAVILLLLCPMCAYADADADTGGAAGSSAEGREVYPEALAASPSNAASVLSDGGGLLASATEEELQRYYQSFMDYPVTLLEWPEEVPQPRFAIAALGVAAEFVLKLLLIAVGIYVVGKFADNIWQLFQDYETHLRLTGDPGLLESWQSILSAKWGSFVDGMSQQYQAFKEFCKEHLPGYGKPASESGIPPTSVDFPHFTSFDAAKYFPDGILFGFTYYRYGYIDLYFPYEVPAVYIISEIAEGDYNVGIPLSIRNNYPYGWCSRVSMNKEDLVLYAISKSSVIMISLEAIKSFPIPVFDSEEHVKNYLKNGDTTGMINSPAVTAPAKHWSDIQREFYDSQTMSDTVYVPTDQLAAQEIENNIADAASAIEVGNALEKTWDLGQLKQGEGDITVDTTYPWVPSITEWLDRLAQGIDGIKEWVSSIPDYLANIWESVQAIPQSIARAFQDVIIGEDDGSYSITQSVSTKFPFCIPFDLINCFRVLQADAAPPVFRIPFVIDLPFYQYSYEIVIDLSVWERPIAVIRFFVLLLYIASLVYATRYLIKG